MKKQPKICAIVAVGPDNVIGKDGVMPWYCKADLYHFRQMTLNKPCIFGRTTFENLLVHPLPDRFNLVCSASYKNEYRDGVFYASSVPDAIAQCKTAGRIFICGGAKIYQYALDNDLIDIMYLTVIRNQLLEAQIKKNPGAYCRFPTDIKIFLNSPNWASKPINYPHGVLPEDYSMTIPEFYKCIRTR